MAPKVFFRTSLTCPHCGTPNDAKRLDMSSPIGNDPDWEFVEPGEVLDVGVDDLEDGYLLLRAPESDRILAIEFFVCESCRVYAPAMLELRARTPYALQFVGATSVPALTKAVLDEANYIARKLAEWTPQVGEDVARIEELKRQL